MSDIIRLLPDSVANQIAAGEVIQRPSSAIKELVENAVDAGATDIRIEVKDAGKTMIRIVDNGSGMSETDARMAFERHATSKIRNADDLFSLHTMGFRGEALPSICAISEVDVRTRTENSDLGTHLLISGSHVETQEPCVCDKGTVITVRKLFFNVPARRKFLKSDSVELAGIMREFERMALVNNGIRMSIDTGSRKVELRAGTFRQRIVDLWKSSLDNQIIPVEVDTSLVKIEGFVSRPEFARRRNPLQFLIANGRNMRNLYFHKAVMECFESLIAADTQPCYFLKFTVDPQTIDVNRSPTKDEIEFEYKHQIRPILQAAIKAALGKFSAVPSIDFSSDALPVRPMREGEIPPAPELGIPKNYNPFRSGYENKPSASDWEKLYENFTRSAENHDSEGVDLKNGFYSDTVENNGAGALSGRCREETLFPEELKEAPAPVCLQYAGRYIITPSREGLMIVDQHRAHVKILYEEYIRRMDKMEMVSQKVMFPESVTLDESQRAALGDIEDDLTRLGFVLEYEADDTWLITAVPAMLKNGSQADVVLRILDSVAEDSVNFGNDGRGELPLVGKAALVMAKSSAVTRGEKLNVAEMENLIGRLFSLPDPAFTPNGNPVFCLLDESRIDRLLV